MILEAGYDGASLSVTDAAAASRAAALLTPGGKAIEGICYPKTVDELKPALDIATRIGARHLNLQPNVRPRRIEDCAPYVEGWLKLAEQVDFPVFFETHRDRMTTDLFFTLDLLDRYPELPLLGDLSHYPVGREFAMPIDEENHAFMRRVMDNCWAFHGRVASREHVQIEISHPHHRIWVDVFLDWWRYGFASWRRRSGRNEGLAFTCELGPKPYAITGADGNHTTDRWAEARSLKELERGVWNAKSSDY